MNMNFQTKRSPLAIILLGLCTLVFAAPPAIAEPPSWAPAQGWRDKQKGQHPGRGRGKRKWKQQRTYAPPEQPALYTPKVRIADGTCNRELLGSLLGGASGGYLGSKIGSGSGNLAATAAGAVIGLIVGGSIGRSMDRLDHACIGQVLEQAETGKRVRWTDPDSNTHYSVTPTRTWRNADNRDCRDYTSDVRMVSGTKRVTGTACRNPDGSWQLMN
jgi:surface antigen